MIGYQDFGTTKAGWVTYYDATNEAIEAANKWIVDQDVSVLNVETVLAVNNGNSSSSFIRVWYEYDGPDDPEQDDESTGEQVEAEAETE